MGAGFTTMMEIIRIETQDELLCLLQELQCSHLKAQAASISLEELMAGLEAASHALRNDTSAIQNIEGLAFLSLWLRTDNIKSLLQENLKGLTSLQTPLPCRGTGNYLKASPLGLVGHWVAGNMPTLAVLSWLQAALTGNVSLVRVSENIIHPTSHILKIIDATAAGELLRPYVRFVNFPRERADLHTLISRHCDGRVIWGGEEAVKTIKALESPLDCVDIIFGPKYSIGVIGNQVQANPSLWKQTVTGIVRDAAAFDQRACSSPQTIFIEKGKMTTQEILSSFKAAFEKLSHASPKEEIDTYTASRIYHMRALYAMNESTHTVYSPGADWTLLLDNELSLKEAIGSRTLFLSLIDDIFSVLPLLSSRIQTMALAIADPDRALQFASEAAFRGVARCVKPGTMHIYETPWDGKLVLNELVRWTKIRL